MAERVRFRGGLTCSCVVASLPLVEKDLQRLGLLKGPLRIFQLGYRGDVSASAGTHDRGGCVDIQPFSAAGIDVWRLWGWTMQDRSPFFKADHCHGWPYKCPHLSRSAQDQEDDWDNRDAGLQGPGKVQGRWPIKPWDVALKERRHLVESTGVPIMAEATMINLPDYPGEQKLSTAGGRVIINADNAVSVVAGSSAGVDVTAEIVVEGLQAGERVRLWWRIEHKKVGQPDKAVRGEPHISITQEPGEPSMGVQVRYAGNLPKAPTGWTACLRLMYTTTAKAARITRSEFVGWKL